jgi:D-3-phosphoglycerate dehydrogenase
VKRVIVTDAAFPALEAESGAANRRGASFQAFSCRTAEDVAQAVRGADVVAVQFAPLGETALRGVNSGCRLIRYGVGYDNIDLAAANRLDLQAAYVPDYCTDEVADHATALILASLRKIPAFDRSVRRGEWAAATVGKPMKPFAETTIGFLGFGRIGRAVRDRLAPFGFRFAIHDPMVGEAEAQALGGAAVELEALLRTSDLITLHAPTTPVTIRVINAASIALMPWTAMIVNTSRGELIDEVALANALRESRLGGAALDVFAREPLPASSPLRDAPNILLSPHAAWYSDAAIAKLQTLVADEIARALDGLPPRRAIPGSTAGARP